MRSTALIALVLISLAISLETHVEAEAKIPQVPDKKKTLIAHWEVTIPFVGCDNGTPVPNIELSDPNGPTPMCPGKQPPDILPQNSSDEAQEGEYETGTVIAVGVSHDKIVIAADSRTARFTQSPRADGTFELGKPKYDDCACKLIQLTPTLLFAADGQVSFTNNRLPANALFDANKLARLAAKNYRSHPDSEEEQLTGGMIAAIATRWAWDVDFRMHHALANGWKPIQRLEGIFVGLEANGETAMVVAKLEYQWPTNAPGAPPVHFTIGKLSPPPTGFTWVEAFGMKDWAQTYYSSRLAPEHPDAEQKRIMSEISKDPKSFSPSVPQSLVDLTIQHYTSTTGKDAPLFVHGPIDLAVLRRKKTITWLHAKQCSGATQIIPHKPSVASPKKAS
jgi:hypothetical protein